MCGSSNGHSCGLLKGNGREQIWQFEAKSVPRVWVIKWAQLWVLGWETWKPFIGCDVDGFFIILNAWGDYFDAGALTHFPFCLPRMNLFQSQSTFCIVSYDTFWLVSCKRDRNTMQDCLILGFVYSLHTASFQSIIQFIFHVDWFDIILVTKSIVTIPTGW